MFKGKPKKRDYKILDPDDDYKKQNIHHLPTISGLIGFCLIIALGYFSWSRLWCLTVALKRSDIDTHLESFISERAWHDLKILNDFGSKPTGSYANEVLAVDFLKREINYIQQNAHKNQRIESDVQVVSGGYYAGFRPHGMTNVYRNVQNVVVKLLGEHERNGLGDQALMLNCHFDSVAGSPGASDDGASCCVMLEVFRVLSSQAFVNKHTILFLFNGAEETPLQASHGFITKHAWAPAIKAFLNLESVGSGGREILFQTGPQNPWLIDAYARAIKYPNGQVAAEEIFHSGIIPSDTDFRIFRDFGNIPGMDFAHIFNGYRYHTKYDSIDFITYEVLQHTGDNILALTKEIANGDELSNTKSYAEGSTVFYDVVGLFFIKYSKGFGMILNIIVVLMLSVVPFVWPMHSLVGMQKKYMRREIIVGVYSTVLAFVSGIGVCYVLGVIYDGLDKSMSWYANPYLVVGLYCCPAFGAQMLAHVVANEVFGNKRAPISLALKVQLQQCGTHLIWGAIILALTLSGYRSGYVGTVILLCVLFSNVIINFARLENTVNKWLYIQLIFQSFVIIWSTHYFHLVLNMFIPITGRSGSFKNPEITIGIICAAVTFLITSYMNHYILLFKNRHRLFFALLLVFIACLFTTTATSIGFPYRDNQHVSPKPQRHFISHTRRIFYDYNRSIRYTDAGFWFREMDRNAKKTIESLVTPDTPVSHFENPMCKTEVFCGLPLYSCRQLHIGGFWLSGPGPIIRDSATLTLNSREKISEHETRLNLTVTGDVLLSLMLRPKPGVTLKNWNILPTVPEPNDFNGDQSYFVMITHGVHIDDDPINILLDLHFDDINHDQPLIDITIVTNHWEYFKEHTPFFAQMLARVPSWAFAVPSVAELRAYIF